MKCGVCGAEFGRKGARWKYCSEACSEDAEKRRSRKRNYNHRRMRAGLNTERVRVDDADLIGIGGLREHMRRLIASGRRYE